MKEKPRYTYMYDLKWLSKKVRETIVKELNLDDSVTNFVLFETSMNVADDVFEEYLETKGIPDDCKISVMKDVKPKEGVL